MKFKSALFFFFFIAFQVVVLSQQNTYEFMRIDMSPRAGDLAGSFVSNNDDPYVIFYNPAGINLLTENPVSFSFVKHLLDINLASISYSTDYEDYGRFAAGIKYINYGSFQGADEVGNKLGEYGAGEVAFIIGYGNSLDENFYYGANVKFIYSGIEERSSTALALDLGLHYSIPGEMMNIGFSVLNIGSQLSYYINTKEDLPLDVVLGVSKKLEHLPLRLSVDFHKLNEERDDIAQRFKAFSVGAEFTLSRVLTLRLGYDNEKRNELKIGNFAGIAGFNVGFGANISAYHFSYGFSSMGAIGSLHRIGITTNI
ncbi:MAG: type IX secretion system protein PorQ [Ignavibacteriaceae bacterium]